MDPNIRVHDAVAAAVVEAIRKIVFLEPMLCDHNDLRCSSGARCWSWVRLQEPVVGELALLLPQEFARNIALQSLGIDADDVDAETVAEAQAEFTNIVAGRFMANLCGDATRPLLGLPRTGRGSPDVRKGHWQGRVFQIENWWLAAFVEVRSIVAQRQAATPANAVAASAHCQAMQSAVRAAPAIGAGGGAVISFDELENALASPGRPPRRQVVDTEAFHQPSASASRPPSGYVLTPLANPALTPAVATQAEQIPAETPPEPARKAQQEELATLVDSSFASEAARLLPTPAPPQAHAHERGGAHAALGHLPQSGPDQATVADDAFANEAARLATADATRSPMRRSISAERIGQYEVLGRIGEGGMGVVYKARHVTLERTVALKIINGRFAPDQDVARRFLREARLAARIEHTHVVTVYDAGEDRGRLFIAMRYVAGGDLSAVLKSRRILPTGEAARLFMGCLSGLEAIAAAGLIHRDIKPSNILLNSQGQPLIADLGLARLRAPGAEGMSQIGGQVMGTPLFMPPEQVLGSQDIDHRADLYALGMTMYMAFTGVSPFNADDLMGLFQKVLNEPVADPCRVNPRLPKGLGRLLVKALQKRPEHRFQTSGEFQAALAALRLA